MLFPPTSPLVLLNHLRGARRWLSGLLRLVIPILSLAPTQLSLILRYGM